MEPENINVESQEEVVETTKVSNFHKVTPLSKYLAMALFILLPFIGGWIGYQYAPEKVVEVERVVGVEEKNNEKDAEMVDEFAIYSKESGWGPCMTGDPNDCREDIIIFNTGKAVIDGIETSIGIDSVLRINQAIQDSGIKEKACEYDVVMDYWANYYIHPKSITYPGCEKELLIIDVVVSNEIEIQRDNDIESKVEEEEVGIIIISPAPNDLVKLPITVTGSIFGNGWLGNEGEVGNAEVFDANDKSISSSAILTATSNWLVLPTEFEAVVGDRQMMSYIETNTGYIKLTNKRVKEDDLVQELIIPVRFK